MDKKKKLENFVKELRSNYELDKETQEYLKDILTQLSKQDIPEHRLSRIEMILKKTEAVYVQKEMTNPHLAVLKKVVDEATDKLLGLYSVLTGENNLDNLIQEVKEYDN